MFLTNNEKITYFLTTASEANYLLPLMAIIYELDVWIHITATIMRFIYTIMNLTLRLMFLNRIDH